MKCSKDIVYIGADDMELDLFEGQYIIPDGISYNSYLIEDEKIAVMDTVDKAKVEKWLDNLDDALHTFYTAPMVHWPEVMVSFEAKDGVLFSADAFGKFGALAVDDDDWACEARRYYFNIVGKYGAQVQALLKKLAALDIKAICPLHGPVLDENLSYYVNLYDVWSSYRAEDEGTFIACASIYGNTAQAADALAEELRSRGEKVVVTDLARCDIAEAVEDAFRYSRMVLAAPTFDGGIFPIMDEFIAHIKSKNYQNRKVAFIENGSWAPMSAKLMRAALEGQKNIAFTDTVITCRSSVPDDLEDVCKKVADELLA